MQDGIGTTTWEYDELSRALSITDPFDDVVGYDYDALGNQTALHYPDGKTVSYDYDLNNFLTSVTDWNNGITSYDYDGAGRLLTVSRPNDVDTAYNYDNAGRLLSITHQNALQTLASYAYQYDNVGNRTQAIESILLPEQPEGLMMPAMPELTPTEIPTPTATPEDTVTPTLESTATPEDTDTPTLEPTTSPTETETPTLTPEPTSIPTETVTPTPVAYAPGNFPVVYRPEPFLRLQSDFNPARQLETLIQTIDYDYDPLYRLTAADYSTGEYFHYTYDYVGNRLTQAKSVNGVQSSDTYLYNVANQLASVNGVNFTWDANGNLINDGVNTYTYDHADRLIAVQNPTTTIENRYNGLGDRVQQSVDGVTTSFTLDLNNPLTQVLADGTNTYLYGLERIAQSSLTIEYFLTDALGSTRQMVDAGGAVQSTASYEPLGAPITNGASSYGFAGEWQDPTGLVFLRARFYSPELGIFLSRDPFPGFLTQPASLTPYQYAFNNPVRYTDPSGENPLFLLIGAIGGLLGGAIYGYGSQVVRNFNSGDFSECPWAAFTTNIDAGQIAFYAVAGTLLGLGIGGIMVGIQALAGFLGAGGAANIACGGDMCASEVQDTGNALKNLGLRFTQNTASPYFSQGGKFSGETIGSLADKLRSGIVNVNNVPINYIERNGLKLIENTRSTLALLRSGISAEKWNLINMTGNPILESKITQRLLSNGLTDAGTTILRITGLGKFISNLK